VVILLTTLGNSSGSDVVIWSQLARGDILEVGGHHSGGCGGGCRRGCLAVDVGEWRLER